MPNDVVGYSTQPVELFGVIPVGKLVKDLFPRDAKHGDYLTHAVLDLYGDKRYDIYWDEKGKVRRRGDDATLAAITRSPGWALVLPFRDKLLFAVLGEASGFLPEKNQFVDHCTPGAEGGQRLGRALGSLADRLAEFPGVHLETRLALRLPFRIGRPVLRPRRETAQVVLEGLLRILQRHGIQPLDGTSSVLCVAGHGRTDGTTSVVSVGVGSTRASSARGRKVLLT